MSKYIKLEDAINVIEDKIAEYIPTLYGRYAEIPLELRMAIEHLPTIEVSEEAISRGYMLEKAQEWKNMYPDSDTAREALTMLMNEMDNAPSVVPSRAEGEWIVSEDGDSTCSVCGASEEEFIYGTENTNTQCEEKQGSRKSMRKNAS